MSPSEVDGFLQGRHTMSVATFNPDGTVHLVAMWYGFLHGAVGLWTNAKSQKILNIRRDPRVTCLVEDGDTHDELRGVELVGRASIIEDQATAKVLGANVFSRYNGPVTDQARGLIEGQSPKRVGVLIDVERVVSWDHSKLGLGGS
jgi:PPOX class probable F420-dependent enzyme